MESHDSEGKILSSFGYKLVPWVNWDEWNYVRRSIFSSSPNLISAALQKISAWESRGCLPIAIDLTAMIIEIRQKDPFFRGHDSIGDALASEKMLNMLYCMFIMRRPPFMEVLRLRLGDDFAWKVEDDICGSD